MPFQKIIYETSSNDYAILRAAAVVTGCFALSGSVGVMDAHHRRHRKVQAERDKPGIQS